MPHEPCIHHWRIESPSGTPEVNAHCTLCGENRRFPTVSTADATTSWSSDATLFANSQKVRRTAHARTPARVGIGARRPG